MSKKILLHSLKQKIEHFMEGKNGNDMSMPSVYITNSAEMVFSSF